MWTFPARRGLSYRPASIALLLGAALLTAPTASASSTTDTFGLGFLAAAGEQNNVSIATNPAGTHLRVHDFGSTNTAFAGSTCVAVGGSPGSVDCPGGDLPLAIVQLLDLADTFTATTITSMPLFIDGGTGSDTLTGGGADDALGGALGHDTANGGAGDDTYDDEVNITLLFGGIHSDGDGNDTFNGNSGEDTFLAGTNATTDDTGVGADTFNGGADTDTADYSGRTAPLTLSVDATAGNDGAAGEGDTLTSAERVLAGSAADTVAAGAGASTLVGNGGGDTLTGGPAADRLIGDATDGGGAPADDTLDGGGGADILIGGPGHDTASYATRNTPVTVTLGAGADDGAAGENDDVRADIERVLGGGAADLLTGDDAANELAGGGGGDTLTGGEGSDTLAGGAGDDRIEARDLSPDTISCGDGADTVVADPVDSVAADCEVVDRPAQVGGTENTGGPTGTGGTTGGSASGTTNGTGSGAGAATAPAPPTFGSKPLRLTGGRRVKVTVTCPGTADCAGELRLSLDRGKRTLAKLSYGVPAGRTRTFALVLSRSSAKRLQPGKKHAVTLSATRTGAALATLRGKL